MRVMYVITSGDAIGGAQIHVRDLATASREAGHEILVVCGTRGDFTDQLATVGVSYRTLPDLVRPINPVKDFAAVRALIRTTHQFAPDLISLHSSKAGIVGRIAGRRTGVPTIFTAHGFAFTGGVPEPQRSVYRLIERALSGSAKAIICVSEHDRQIAIRAGFHKQRLVTIHNGMPDITPALRAGPAIGEPLRIVMTARLDRQKDHETLFRALTLNPGIETDLIGDGPGRDDLIALAERLGIRARIHFLGRRNDVAEILSRGHMFVLSSHWEGFPRSTLEAMRAGLPVIVSDVGGAAEAIDDGVSGFVVPPGDRETLAERIRELAFKSELRDSMGQAGRTRYERDFIFPIMLKRTLALQQRSIARTDNSAD